MPGEFIPIIAIVMTFSVPIIAILVHHQRKMAELIHSQHVQAMQPSAETAALRREIAELRHLMHEQAIAMDDLKNQLALRNLDSGAGARFSA
jgi:uncharacterized membrane protein (DUF106 family)